MNSRSIIPILAGAVALVGFATALALEHQNRLQLREERQALQRQLDQMTDLLAEKERQATLLPSANTAQPVASNPLAELRHLRAEFAALRQLTNELELARNENTEAHAALDGYVASETTPKVATADFWPRDSWSFAGSGTPDDAVRSSLWAADNGNLKALLDGTTGDLRQMMEKELEGKSADEAAIWAMDVVSKLKSVQVLNRDYQSADTALLTVTLEDGDRPHTEKLLLKKVGNQWRIAGKNGN